MGIIKYIRIHSLKFYFVFGLTKYMNHLVKIYSKYNIKFVGKPIFIAQNVYFDMVDQIIIGGGTTIGRGTVILTHDNSVNYAHLDGNEKFILHAPVVIKENSFVGQNCFILPGVIIGENSIVGAGSVVTKNIPANEVWAGNPARFIETIEKYKESLLLKKRENITKIN